MILDHVRVDTIFLDLDGVLADWIGSACRVHGRDPDAVITGWSGGDLAHQLGMSGNAMWGKIDTAGEQFWSDLEPYPWMDELVGRARARVGASNVIVLTSPSRHPSSLSGKLRWMNRHLGNGKAFRNFLIGPQKAACAGPNRLLVDDRAKLVQGFRDAGGLALLFPRPWNAGREIAHDPMAAVGEWF